MQIENNVQKVICTANFNRRAVCVLKKTEFDFVSMVVKTPHAFSGKVVHVPTRHHVNDQAGFADLYAVGEVYNVVVKSNDDSVLVGVLEKHEKLGEGGGRGGGGRKRAREGQAQLQFSLIETLKLTATSRAM